jgi:hypothetical protein
MNAQLRNEPTAVECAIPLAWESYTGFRVIKRHGKAILAFGEKTTSVDTGKKVLPLIAGKGYAFISGHMICLSFRNAGKKGSNYYLFMPECGHKY